MKTTLVAAGILALSLSCSAIGGAMAADLPQRSDPSPPPAMEAPRTTYNWNGFYAGIHAGYGWGSFNGGASALFKGPTGAVIGGQLGYNYQTGNFLVGVEGDLYWAGLSGKRTFGGPVFTHGAVDWAGSLRARVGFAADSALVYLTTGYGIGKIAARVNDTTIPALFASSGTRGGWILGGGIEYAFANHISVRTEYLYTRYSSKTILGGAYLSSSGVSTSVVRIGANYHF